MNQRGPQQFRINFETNQLRCLRAGHKQGMFKMNLIFLTVMQAPDTCIMRQAANTWQIIESRRSVCKTPVFPKQDTYGHVANIHVPVHRVCNRLHTTLSVVDAPVRQCVSVCSLDHLTSCIQFERDATSGNKHQYRDLA